MRVVIGRSICLFMLLLVPSRVGAAQDFVTVSGAVTTRVDGMPVPGAVVSVVGADASTVTDANGRYTTQAPNERVRGGRLQVKVDALGLPSKFIDVAVDAATLTVDVALTLEFGEHVTVGSRAAGALAEKAVPVDVITRDQIASSGYSETAQIIQSLTPSFNFPRPTISDGTDTVRPATLRGLGPDQVLVLINGKRRHQSALVHVNDSIGRGSTGVDLNAIPVSAIDHIEVLRDGAAAQYGSDAIAGVINIVLRSGVARPDVTLNVGLSKGTFAGNRCASDGLTCTEGNDIDFTDGELADVGGSWGIAGRQGQSDRRRRIPAPQPHEPCVVRPTRSDRRRRCRPQRRRRAQSSLGRSGYARRHGIRQRQRSVEQPADTFSVCIRRLQPTSSEQRRILSASARRAQLAANLSARLSAGD